MSRIHEALKRAEQARAASANPPATTSDESGIAKSAVPADTLSDAQPGEVTTVSLEELEARCARSTWSPQENTVLFFEANRERVGMEEFRVLRSRLYQMQEKTGIKKLLITSALPREGKSFVAANLAQVLCHRNGRRALLVDADLRAPNLHKMFGIASKPGLSDYLLGEKDLFDVISAAPADGLFTIPAGNLARNPAELATNGRLKHLFAQVETLFDWIIVDSPPVPVSETGLLATYCDAVLLVVRSETTPFHIARKARAELEDRLLIGVVLNGIDPQNSPYTHYYYNYYAANKTYRKIQHKKQQSNLPASTQATP